MPQPPPYGRLLSPWEQAPYWQNVKETQITATGALITAVGADPNRVALLFTANSLNTTYVTTLSGGAVASGIALTTAFPTLILSHHEVGNLVSQQFYWTGAAVGDLLDVIEISLSKWPGET